jgi:hypothetical protein
MNTLMAHQAAAQARLWGDTHWRTPARVCLLLHRPDDVRKMFEKYGEVRDVYLPLDHYTRCAVLLWERWLPGLHARSAPSARPVDASCFCGCAHGRTRCSLHRLKRGAKRKALESIPHRPSAQVCLR